MSENMKNSAEATKLEKISFHSNPKEDNAKECSNYHTILLISHAIKQGYAQIPSSQASAVRELRTSRGTSQVQKRQRNQRSNCQHLLAHREKKGIPEKNLLLLHWLCKACDCDNKLWKVLRVGNIRPPYLPAEKSVCRSRSNSQKQTWNNRLVQNWGRNTSRLCIVTLLI